MPVETKISFSDGSSSETLRKYSDEFTRKHLSDHSVVLTEDTDSFIIGERVWVGGSKPGQIAYIGDTQFAPGEWAGIVLDDPIGKNDGSVAGTRYFQCPEKRGVFSRLSRLTRTPLVAPSPHDASPSSDAGSVFERPPSGMRVRRTLSPDGSVRSFVSSKMNMSVSTSAGGGALRLGERVIVSSSRGSKAGTLRYVGAPEFASGMWAGVELDDPLGKNDGAVDGKRYFECEPRFGLFAPIAKVSRSPSNRKPGACAIHSNGRATPLRRSTSRDSLTSLGTSIASSVRTAQRGVRLGVTSLGGAQRVSGPRASSTPVSAKNALQELLREKQQHLERLMRERELERAEVAKYTLQADRAETALAQLRTETVHTVQENEKLKTDLNIIAKRLEDEKQKVEDLLFRSEEENINKEDYNKYKDATEAEKAELASQLRELEAEAALQAARADAAAASALALDDRRAADVAALHAHHREELAAAQVLSSELQKLLDEAYALLKEKENEKDSIGKSMSEELSKVRAEYEKALSEAKSKIAIAETAFETQLSVMNAKLQVTESKLEAEKLNVERLNKDNSQTIIDLNTKLSQTQAALDDKTYELNKLTGSSKEHELTYTKEITKLKMELSAKILDLEQTTDAHKKLEHTNKTLSTDIQGIKEECAKKINEYEVLLSESSQQTEKFTSDLLDLQQKYSAKVSEYEKIVAESRESSVMHEQLLSKYKETVHERDKEIVKLKDDFEKANANFNKSHSLIAEEHKNEIEVQNLKIDKLTNELKEHQQALHKSKSDFDALNSKVSINVNEIEVLTKGNNHLTEMNAELVQTNNQLRSKISEMELEIGELNRQLISIKERCSEVEKAKQKVEIEYLNLTGQSTDSNEQFSKLTQALRETEKELQELRDLQREKSNDRDRLEQELRCQIAKIEQEYTTERDDLINKLKLANEKILQTEENIKQIEIRASSINNELEKQDTSYKQIIDENQNLKKEKDIFNEKEIKLLTDLQDMEKKFEKSIEEYKQNIQTLKADSELSETKLKVKVDQLVEAQNDLNNKLEESHKAEEILKKNLEDVRLQLDNNTVEIDRELKQKQSDLVAAQEELSKHKLEHVHINVLVEEKDNIIRDLSLKLAMFEVDFKSNVEVIAEKERQLVTLNEELAKMREYKQNVEEKFNTTILQVNSLQQKYDALIANSSIDESVVKDQNERIESLNQDISSLVQEKSILKEQLLHESNQSNELKEKYQEFVQKLDKNEENIEQLKNCVQEKDSLLKSKVECAEMAMAKVSALEEQLSALQIVLQQKEQIVVEKEQQLVQSKEFLQSGSLDTQAKIKLLDSEIVNLNKNHSTEVELLTKTIASLKSCTNENEKQLKELQHFKEKSLELSTALSKSEADIKQLTNINDGQKANYEDLNRQLDLQYSELKKENKQMRYTLKETAAGYERALQEAKDKFKLESSKQAVLQAQLDESLKNALELSNKVELLTVQQNNSHVEQNGTLEKLTIELQSLRKSNSETLAAKEDVITKLKTEIEKKINDLNKKETTITKLNDEVKNLKAKTEIAQREKILLEKEFKEKGDISKDNNDNGLHNHKAEEALKSIEEREITEGQVSFLNSVIVDMQRKNEQLLARVHALETCAPPDLPPLNGKKARAVAPRLFCDICDVFDAHDTEDCPRQAADEPESPSVRRPPPAPRPYCDICEVFGHTTENCDEEETF